MMETYSSLDRDMDTAQTTHGNEEGNNPPVTASGEGKSHPRYRTRYGLKTAPEAAYDLLDRAWSRLRFLEEVLTVAHHDGDGFEMRGYSSMGLAAILEDIAIDVYWGISAIVIAVLVYKGNFHPHPTIGIFTKILIVAFGTVGSQIGVKIGRVVRDFTMPSGFLTTGGLTDIAKTKIFWAIGPQLIGWFLGLLVGAGIPFGINKMIYT